MDSYEMRELAMFRKQMEETEKLPLAERKANAVEWYKDLSENYMMVAERVGWLLNGSYGKGSFDSACRVLASPRMNQVAWCAITIANLEWRCPAKFAIQAWKKMPVEKRYLANQAIRQAIEDAKREGYCGEIKKNPRGRSAHRDIWFLSTKEEVRKLIERKLRKGFIVEKIEEVEARPPFGKGYKVYIYKPRPPEKFIWGESMEEYARRAFPEIMDSASF